MHRIFTIGYEGTDIDTFIETLTTVGIETLVDVRALPLSRKKGFSKKGLSEALEAAGISYLHLRDLGDPKPGRDAARRGDYETFNKVFTTHMETDEAQVALERLATIATRQICCMMCFERDACGCHRRIVGNYLTPFGFDFIDLYGDAPARYKHRIEELQSRHLGQGVAAAQ